MTKDEWIALYEKKTGSTWWNEPGDTLLFSEQRGLFSYTRDDSRLLIKGVVGDGRYWDRFSDELCKALCLKEKLFFTHRNSGAWERMLGFSLVRKQSEHGYLMRKEVV